MADFHVFTGDEVIATALPGLLNTNFNSIKSDFAGTAFPTSNLVVGMTCYRTDQKKVYRLMSDLSTWKLESDLNYDGGLPIATQAEAEALADNTKVMTPLRTKQSITKQVFGGGSVVPTTSGGTGNANGIAPSADKLATARYINGVSFNGTANITNYVECTTAASTVAKTVTVTGFSLVKGASIRVKFTNGNTAASPTLNVNSTGAKSIMYWGYALKGSSSEITANSVYELCYDGSYWRLMSEVGMTGATSSVSGTRGLVPTPPAGSQDKTLHGDGTWKEVSGFDSYWKASEQVQVGDIRYPKGRENSGYIFECTSAGTTGSTQPEFLENGSIELANFADLGKIGSVRVIFNMAEKEVDEVLALGVLYSRSTYPELWEWAGKRAGLIISEAEWQQKYTASNGKFVPYYSLGDGSTTFRTPLLGAYLKGAENSADVGKYVDAGLPAINGKIFGASEGGSNFSESRPSKNIVSGSSGSSPTATTAYWDTSRNWVESTNPIYGNSDTVTPDTMVGIWVIKAIGVVVDSGNTDLANMLQGVEQLQTGLSVVENKVNNIKPFMPDYNAGVDITSILKTSPYSYTAPSDGVIKFLIHGDTNWVINETSTSDTTNNLMYLDGQNGVYVTSYLQISKGKTIYNNGNRNAVKAIFYPYV